jgi:hypothetical protein
MSFLLLAITISAVSALLQSQSSSSDALDVDLGYEIYQGFNNATSGINTWRGKNYKLNQ